MRRFQTALALLALASMTAGDAAASGVGASFYVPAPVTAPAASCPTGHCGPVASCQSCQRLGFACVDHATPPPCTAEGGCYPARSSFGWNRPRWRRWPGTEEAAKPQVADEREDSLLPDFDPPAPEEEDQQAPPPIEDEPPVDDVEAEESFEGFDNGVDQGDDASPAMELSLPPLPEGPIPTPRPVAPGFQDGPPGLPFGFAPPATPAQDQDAWGPPAPRFGATRTPNTQSGRAGANPPPLPRGFTSGDTGRTLRRLPTPSLGRYDSAVRPVSGYLPLPR